MSKSLNLIYMTMKNTQKSHFSKIYFTKMKSTFTSQNFQILFKMYQKMICMSRNSSLAFFANIRRCKKSNIFCYFNSILTVHSKSCKIFWSKNLNIVVFKMLKLYVTCIELSKLWKKFLSYSQVIFLVSQLIL